MEFTSLKNPIRKLGYDTYIIGDNPLKPQLTVGENNLQIDEAVFSNFESKSVNIKESLSICGVPFIDYITSHPSFKREISNTISSSRHSLREAFELDELGDLTPSNAENVSDEMWILRPDGDLELRSNHWRYNIGPEAFTEDISF